MSLASYTWSQHIFPTTVGTVMVTVDEGLHRTWSTTIYHEEFAHNGSMSIFTRTDTDTAGTVTQVIVDVYRMQRTM